MEIHEYDFCEPAQGDLCVVRWFHNFYSARIADNLAETLYSSGEWFAGFIEPNSKPVIGGEEVMTKSRITGLHDDTAVFLFLGYTRPYIHGTGTREYKIFLFGERLVVSLSEVIPLRKLPLRKLP